MDEVMQKSPRKSAQKLDMRAKSSHNTVRRKATAASMLRRDEKIRQKYKEMIEAGDIKHRFVIQLLCQENNLQANSIRQIVATVKTPARPKGRERDDKIVEMASLGMSNAYISEHLKIHRNTVSNVLGRDATPESRAILSFPPGHDFKVSDYIDKQDRLKRALKLGRVSQEYADRYLGAMEKSLAAMRERKIAELGKKPDVPLDDSGPKIVEIMRRFGQVIREVDTGSP